MSSSNKFRKPFNVKRSAGNYVAGRWEETEVSDFEILASAQPASQEDMNAYKAMNSGKMGTVKYRFYTNTELLTDGDSVADKIEINGEFLTVFAIYGWSNTRLSHFKYLAVKEGAL